MLTGNVWCFFSCCHNEPLSQLMFSVGGYYCICILVRTIFHMTILINYMGGPVTWVSIFFIIYVLLFSWSTKGWRTLLGIVMFFLIYFMRIFLWLLFAYCIGEWIIYLPFVHLCHIILFVAIIRLLPEFFSHYAFGCPIILVFDEGKYIYKKNLHNDKIWI